MGTTLGTLPSRVKGKGGTRKRYHNKCGFRLDYGVQVYEDYGAEQDRSCNMWILLKMDAILLSSGFTDTSGLFWGVGSYPRTRSWFSDRANRDARVSSQFVNLSVMAGTGEGCSRIRWNIKKPKIEGGAWDEHEIFLLQVVYN